MREYFYLDENYYIFDYDSSSMYIAKTIEDNMVCFNADNLKLLTQKYKFFVDSIVESRYCYHLFTCYDYSASLNVSVYHSRYNGLECMHLTFRTKSKYYIKAKLAKHEKYFLEYNGEDSSTFYCYCPLIYGYYLIWCVLYNRADLIYKAFSGIFNDFCIDLVKIGEP